MAHLAPNKAVMYSLTLYLAHSADPHEVVLIQFSEVGVRMSKRHDGARLHNGRQPLPPPLLQLVALADLGSQQLPLLRLAQSCVRTMSPGCKMAASRCRPPLLQLAASTVTCMGTKCVNLMHE